MLKSDILLSLGECAQFNSPILALKGPRDSTHGTPHPVQSSLEPFNRPLSTHLQRWGEHYLPRLPIGPSDGSACYKFFLLLKENEPPQVLHALVLPLSHGALTFWGPKRER